MRKALIPLAPLLLAGCLSESASYFIDGNQYTLTLRAEQDYFWSKQVTLRLIASRLPECQRQLVLGDVPAAGLEVELFGDPDTTIYTLRAGEEVWQLDSQNCALLETPQQTAAQPLGLFRLQGKSLVFEPTGESTAG